MPIIRINNAVVEHVRRGGVRVQAVAGITFSINQHEIVGLVGESGSGKSTLARAILGLLPLASGSIEFKGEPIARLGLRRRPRSQSALQMVFQNPYASLNPRRRVGDQIVDAIRPLRLPSFGKRARVQELLAEVGLEATDANAYPHQFSGGQRQRLAIARALGANPEFLVLDEPLSSLDASAQAQIANLLNVLNDKHGIGQLLISHDLTLVRQLADRIAVMYLGVIVEQGPAERLWANPLHPYTQALIRSVPAADDIGRLPEALPGEIPNPAQPPEGCRFHPRCPLAFERCKQEVPSLRPREDGRDVACWLYGETGGGSRGSFA